MAVFPMVRGVPSANGAYKGEFTLDQTTVTVPLPFETKHLFVYRVGGSNNYQITISYDANIETDKQVRHYISAGTKGADYIGVNSTNSDALQSVSSSQFVYKTSDVTNWGGTYEFIAIPM